MPSTKKLLIPAFDFKPALGGVAHYGHELSTALQQQGDVEVRVIGRNIFGCTEYDDQAPFQVERYGTSDIATLSIPSWVRALRFQIKEWQPDAILCPLWFPDAVATDLAQLNTKKPIPYFITVHAMEVLPAPSYLRDQVREQILKPFRKRVFQNCQQVFAVSNFARELTLVNTVATPDKVTVINNGVNTQTFFKTTPPWNLKKELGLDGAKVILTVTRLQPYKGVDKVIESLPEVLKTQPKIKYVVVGDGPDRQRLEERVQSLKLTHHVVFLGAVDQKRIIDLYSIADLFVMLSRQEARDVEGFGLVFLEAAACGLPSLGGNSGGIPDAIEDGKTGWLVDPTNISAIAKKLSELLSRDELRAQASEAGLKMVPHRSWDAVAKKIAGAIFG